MNAWCWPKVPGVYQLCDAWGGRRNLTLHQDGRWRWGGLPDTFSWQELRACGWRGIPWRIEVTA